VPTPADGTTLYLKLRDDPDAVAAITLPAPVQKPAPVPVPTAQAPSSAPNTAHVYQDSAPGPKGLVPGAVPASEAAPPQPGTPNSGAPQP